MTADLVLRRALLLGEALLWSCVATEFAGWAHTCLGMPTGWAVAMAASMLLAFVVCLLRDSQPAGPDRRRAGRMSSAAGLLASVAGVWIASLAVARWFLDVSWDGQAYHQLAVINLVDGWNPLRGPLALGDFLAIPVNTYPKGTWIAEAFISGTTGWIETGKALNILVACASLLVTIGAATYHQRGRLQWVVVAVLAASGPVVISQMLSFCVDGQLASLLLLVAVELFVCWPAEGSWRHLAVAAGAVFLTFGTKHTGPVFSLSLVVAAACACRAADRRRIAAWISAGVVAGLLVNLNPYLTNTITYGNPFYPVMGKDAPGSPRREILGTPSNFEHRLWLTSTAFSMFSESSTCENYSPGRLKVPGQVSTAELAAFGRGEAVRAGGFGPLFSLEIILGVCVLVGIRRRDVDVRQVLLVLSLVLPTVVLPAWWARYVPQFWFVPLGGAWILMRRRPHSMAGAAAVAMLAVAAANVALVAFGAGSFQYRMTKAIHSQLATLQEQGPIAVQLDTMASTGRRLTEAGVHWRPTTGTETCIDRWSLIGTDSAYCCRAPN